MSKTGKIIYLFISLIFFIIINGYLSEIIIQNGYTFTENPIFSITFIQNQGAAFNIFEGYKAFLITFSIIAVVLIIYYVIMHIKKISSLGLFFISLLTAGICNNMLERILFGYVRDFIKLNFVDFPVFNLSDIFINIGVIAVIILILKNNYLKNNEQN